MAKYKDSKIDVDLSDPSRGYEQFDDDVKRYGRDVANHNAGWLAGFDAGLGGGDGKQVLDALDALALKIADLQTRFKGRIAWTNKERALYERAVGIIAKCQKRHAARTAAMETEDQLETRKATKRTK